MIRHIVAWKLRANGADAKRESSARIRALLEGLRPVIPQIKELAVSENVVLNDLNWDLVLVADYDSAEDLKAYQVHPNHQAASAEITSLVSDRASVDFEF
jgi:Stress responsive A/B Barrel Domain